MSRPHEIPIKQDADYNTDHTQKVQRHISRVVSEMVQKTGPLPPSAYCVQNDTRPPVPTYVLKDNISGVEETGPGAKLDSCGSYAIKRSLTRIKSSNCSNKTLTSTQRPISPTTRRPSQQQCSKVSAEFLAPSAARNKSMECNALRPNVTKLGVDQSTRRAIRPSHTSSATATRCSIPAARVPVSRPITSTQTNRQLQRKVHSGKASETESTSKRIQTYSIKKPLPYKANSATSRSQRSAAKSIPESSCISPSSESLFTQMSDDIDDDTSTVLQQSHVNIHGALNNARGKPKLAASPKTPTQKPSVKQLKDAWPRHNQVDHQQQSPRVDISEDVMLQSYANGQLSAARCNKGKKEHMQTDEQAVGTIRSHTSPSEHSFSSKYGSRYYTEQMLHDDDPGSLATDFPTRHVQIARKPADNTDERHQPPAEQYQQAAGPMSSASQESVVNCRPHHLKSRMLRRPPPTLSMSTLVTDAGRFVRRPVPVAPSGPAGHRRVSRIPRPKLAVRPSISVTSTLSKCSSVTSLRSEFNYARPMPIERIPFSKFGLECIVPLARQEVSVAAVEAFSITGVSGQRKRFLPLTESIADDLWQRVYHIVDALPVASAQHDAGQDACTVSITSSTVARPVSHAATQTRKSVSLTPSTSTRQRTKKPGHVARKEKPDETNNEDYSGMLVRLVQLIYLQTKLNATKADKNNSASNEATSGSSANRSTSGANASQTPLLGYLQNYQLRGHHSAPTGPAQINARPQSSDHGARVYRMGSSVTQVYSKNQSSTPVGHADVESANSWANAIKSRTLRFDHAQSETKPWSNYRNLTPTAFKPSYNQRYQNYDNRRAKISSYPASSSVRNY